MRAVLWGQIQDGDWDVSEELDTGQKLTMANRSEGVPGGRMAGRVGLLGGCREGRFPHQKIPAGADGNSESSRHARKKQRINENQLPKIKAQSNTHLKNTKSQTFHAETGAN